MERLRPGDGVHRARQLRASPARRRVLELAPGDGRLRAGRVHPQRRIGSSGSAPARRAHARSRVLPRGVLPAGRHLLGRGGDRLALPARPGWVRQRGARRLRDRRAGLAPGTMAGTRRSTLLTVWKNIGFNAVLYLTALQALPQSVFEAAALDGASAARRVRHITDPAARADDVLRRGAGAHHRVPVLRPGLRAHRRRPARRHRGARDARCTARRSGSATSATESPSRSSPCSSCSASRLCSGAHPGRGGPRCDEGPPLRQPLAPRAAARRRCVRRGAVPLDVHDLAAEPGRDVYEHIATAHVLALGELHHRVWRRRRSRSTT